MSTIILKYKVIIFTVTISMLGLFVSRQIYPAHQYRVTGELLLPTVTSGIFVFEGKGPPTMLPFSAAYFNKKFKNCKNIDTNDAVKNLKFRSCKILTTLPEGMIEVVTVADDAETGVDLIKSISNNLREMELVIRQESSSMLEHYVSGILNRIQALGIEDIASEARHAKEMTAKQKDLTPGKLNLILGSSNVLEYFDRAERLKYSISIVKNRQAGIEGNISIERLVSPLHHSLAYFASLVLGLGLGIVATLIMNGKQGTQERSE